MRQPFSNRSHRRLKLTIAQVLVAVVTASQALADFEPTAAGPVICIGVKANGAYVVGADGAVWFLNLGSPPNWQRILSGPLPIPTAEVALFEYPYLVTRSGNVWFWQFPEGWIDAGPPPTTTSNARESWSTQKNKYRN